MNDLQKFHQLVSEANSILITGHRDADNDALAGALSIYFLIQEKYPDKKARIMSSPSLRENLKHFANFEKIEAVGDITDHLEGIDLIIMLDGNYAERFTLRPDALRASSAKKICFDHHASPADKFDLAVIDSNSTSTAEVIYFSLVEERESIPKELCEILYMGLNSDTNRFTYVRPSQSRVFSMAERLLREGNIDAEMLMTEYFSFSKNVFDIFREFLKNARAYEIAGWPPFLTWHVTRDFVQSGGYEDLEVHEASDITTQYLKFVRDIPWGFSLYIAGNDVKISLRSRKDGVNVRKIVEGLKIGSGHDFASGGRFSAKEGEVLDTPEILEKMLDWLKNNKPRREKG